MLTRPDIAQITYVLHEKIAKMKAHQHETPEMHEFRLKPWRDLLVKLKQMFVQQEGL